MNISVDIISEIEEGLGPLVSIKWISEVKHCKEFFGR